ncbi:hexokinase [Thermoanaerobacterium sp. PSU-2]|uniref:hexokinase family protein n=1 Tax=Thermoanaerobacterium sp. PSU-2 TaxID=1930849 RepID=UPI000A165EDA|nr:hexokinase [Thermoanaerobacterium sp. PSU-2]ORX23785.1 hexokinase [Thermoanaerobacterium sp. PSU-2]
MKSNKEKVTIFLKKYGMHYEDINVDRSIDDFIKEMEKGLNGEEDTSLKMLCTYISLQENVPLNEPVIVIDAGGTNFRRAVVTFNGIKAIIEDFKTYDMPGTKGEITSDEFFNTIAEYIEPIIHKSSKIGFCFSYPTEILPNKDGKLIKFNKEVKVKDMIGVEIGSALLRTLKERGYENCKKAVLLNDTVATLLGGKAECPDREFDSYIGFILGTGTNTCYIEKNTNIKKVEKLSETEGDTIINIESGGYAKAPRGIIDEIFDKTTADPGNQKFEKMISGAYQGGLILEVIRKAIDEGLFSSKFKEKFKNVDNLTSKEITDFCYFPYSNDNVLANYSNTGNFNSNENDKQTLYYIIDAIIERAAKLTVINLASVILKIGKGNNPCKPVCITAEGSTFYKSKLFRNKLDYYVKQYLNDKYGLYCEFIKAENATLIGTAIAGLIN